MLCLVRRYGLFLFLLVYCPQLVTAAIPNPTEQRELNVPTDDEYDRYRKKGDAFFKAGRYGEARQQYQNCLEVPGFEDDEYAKGRIELTTRCLALLQQADEALQSQHDTLLVRILQEVLTLNPSDGSLVNRIAEHYEQEGNRLFADDKLFEARGYYLQAIVYTRRNGNRIRQNTLETQVKAIDARLEQLESEQEKFLRVQSSKPVTSTTPVRHRVSMMVPALKIGLGVVAVSSGLVAYSLHHNFKLKKERVEQLNDEFDRNPKDTHIDRIDLEEQYNTAFAQMEQAYRQQTLYRVCLGVATAAVLGEAYLLIRKHKPHHFTGFFWQPAPTGYGLQIGYRF